MARYYATNGGVTVVFIGIYKEGVHDKQDSHHVLFSKAEFDTEQIVKTLKAIVHR
jgi:hypothetical protein